MRVTCYNGLAIIKGMCMEEDVVGGNSFEKTARKIRKTTLKKVLSSVSKVKKGMLVGGILLVVLIGMGVYVYFEKKSWFMAALVNGSPVSRLSVIQELEKQGGKEVLENMIMKKLITDEVHRLKVVIKRADIDAELKKTEEQIVSQGGTLDDARAQQGVTREDLLEQILMKKQIEHILGDKMRVSDEEIEQYVKENKLAPTKNMNAAELKNQVRDQLQSTKFSTEAQRLIADLREKADVVRYIEY